MNAEITNLSELPRDMIICGKPDPRKGQIIEQHKVAELLGRDGKPLSTRTVLNWMKKGLNGVVLPSVKRAGHARSTTLECLLWFLAEVERDEFDVAPTLPNAYYDSLPKPLTPISLPNSRPIAGA